MRGYNQIRYGETSNTISQKDFCELSLQHLLKRIIQFCHKIKTNSKSYTKLKGKLDHRFPVLQITKGHEHTNVNEVLNCNKQKRH